jgi:hypothetical protein
VVRAEHGPEAKLRRRSGLERRHRDGSSAPSPVQRRHRPPEHLDALHEGKVEGIHFGLTVREGGGDSVYTDLDPADPEGCPCAEPSQRESRVLREVEARLREGPGDQVHRVLESKSGAAGQELLPGDDGDG